MNHVMRRSASTSALIFAAVPVATATAVPVVATASAVAAATGSATAAAIAATTGSAAAAVAATAAARTTATVAAATAVAAAATTGTRTITAIFAGTCFVDSQLAAAELRLMHGGNSLFLPLLGNLDEGDSLCSDQADLLGLVVRKVLQNVFL